VGRVAAKALTAKQVENESAPGYHADGPNTGLYLQVTPNGSGFTRSWVYRYTSPTILKHRELGLGPSKGRKLADRLSLCAELRVKVLNGIVTLRMNVIAFALSVLQPGRTRSPLMRRSDSTKIDKC